MVCSIPKLFTMDVPIASSKSRHLVRNGAMDPCVHLGEAMCSRFLLFLLPALATQAAPTSGWTLAGQERFLRTARVVNEVYAGKGINDSKKAMLTDGRRKHLAHIQFIDIYKPLFKGKDGSEEKDFKDTWKFNVAAYRMARLLGLAHMTPPSVQRMVDGKPAS